MFVFVQTCPGFISAAQFAQWSVHKLEKVASNGMNFAATVADTSEGSLHGALCERDLYRLAAGWQMVRC